MLIQSGEGSPVELLYFIALASTWGFLVKGKKCQIMALDVDLLQKVVTENFIPDWKECMERDCNC